MDNYELNISNGERIWTYVFQANGVESVNTGMCVIFYALEDEKKVEIAMFSHSHSWICVNTDEVNKS